MIRTLRQLVLALVCCIYGLNSSADDAVHLQLPKHRIQPDELAIIVNDTDPLSVRIADYYRDVRSIPAENLLHVRFRPGAPGMKQAEFERIEAQVKQQAGDNIQAYAITWAAPYRVECMSITSAFTFGFDRSWCASKRCSPTRYSPYYNQHSSKPWSRFGIRPTVAIAAQNFAFAKQLIDRGVASDASHPQGTAYLLSTTDRARNVRTRLYKRGLKLLENSDIKIEIVETDALRNKKDVLFYFTGRVRVEGLDSLNFLPGAIADHLTSAGGKLTNSKQMSSLRWLEAGATGSYGTVVEPCNLLGKFPFPALAIDRYSRGKTLLEAYWQSVQQPGEGIFIGDPLAAPFDGYKLLQDGNQLVLETRTLWPGEYRILVARTPVGPYTAITQTLRVQPGQKQFHLPLMKGHFYRIESLHPRQPAG